MGKEGKGRGGVMGGKGEEGKGNICWTNVKLLPAPLMVPGERATSCDGRGLEREVAICVNVCPCHANFVLYDDWRSLVLRCCCLSRCPDVPCLCFGCCRLLPGEPVLKYLDVC